MDDDLIRRALGADRDLVAPSEALVERAIVRGRRRRRNRTAVTTGAGALALVAVVAFAVDRGDDSIVSVTPSSTSPRPTTTSIDPSPTSTASPLAPTTTTVPATTVPPTATTSTTSTTTTSTTTTSTTAAPADPLQGALTSGTRTVRITVEARPSDAPDTFAVFAADGTTQLWTYGGTAASPPTVVARLSVEPCMPDVACVTPHAYDGRYLWVTLAAVAADDLVTLLESSQLIRADLATGELTVVPVPDLPADRVVEDVLPDGDGGAAVAATVGAELWTWQVDRTLVSTGASPVSIATDGAVSARFSDDGLRLAYTWAVPSESVSSVHVVDLPTGANRTLADRAGTLPVIVDWSEDGRQLLVSDVFEERYSFEVPTAGGGALETTYVEACYDRERLVVGRWFTGYAESPPEAGPLEVLDASRSVIRTLSESMVGGQMVCLGSGSVVIRVDDLDTSGRFAGPSSLVVFGPDGTHIDLGPGLTPFHVRALRDR